MKNNQTNLPTPPNSKSIWVDLGSWVSGIGLVLLGLHCFVFEAAADGYGVAPVGQNGLAYLLAAGMRDLALGLITIFLYLKHRSALAVYFLCLTIIPFADTLIVLRYGNSVWNLTPHVIGVCGLLIIALLAFNENKQEKQWTQD